MAEGASSWAMVREVMGRGALLGNLVSLELKMRYRRSVLGLLWTLLNPLLFAAVIWLVFGRFARGGEPSYPMFLLSGIMTWTVLSGAISASLNAVLNQEALLRKVYVPKMIFPVAVTASELVNFGFFLAAYLLVLPFSPISLGPNLVLLVPAVVMVGLYCIGFALLFSCINVFLRDVSHLSAAALRLLFYLSPVVYPASLLGDAAWMLRLNPLHYPIEAVRHAIYYSGPSSPDLWYTGFGIGFVLVLLGLRVFARTERALVYYL